MPLGGAKTQCRLVLSRIFLRGQTEEVKLGISQLLEASVDPPQGCSRLFVSLHE